MKPQLFSAKLTLWVNRFIALLLAVMLFLLPRLLDWYCNYRSLTQAERVAILAAFYCCAVVIAVALWNLDGLLRNILMGKVFVPGNVACIRRIQWCCCGVSLICLPAAVVYLPLIFLVVIMAFLCLVVSVVAQVMKAAVAIREENDLTI